MTVHWLYFRSALAFLSAKTKCFVQEYRYYKSEILLKSSHSPKSITDMHMYILPLTRCSLNKKKDTKAGWQYNVHVLVYESYMCKWCNT